MAKNALILILAAALAFLLWQQATRVPETVTVVEKVFVPAPPVQVAQVTEPVESAIHKILREAPAQPGLQGAAIGFCLMDAKGAVIEDHQAKTAFIPASSLKTVTTSTALEVWGPEYQIDTKLCAKAAPKDGVIQGDLIILGGGDPMLSLADLHSMAADLKKRGVTRIQGRIIGDGRLFKGSIYDDFWNWGDIGNGYGSGVSGLNLEHNRYTAVFRAATAIGQPAAFLGTDPEVPGVTAINETLTGAADSGDGVVIHGGEHTGVVHLRGSVPFGETAFQILGAVPDPEYFTAHHLRKILITAGITVSGEAVAYAALKSAPTEAKEVLITHRSPSLTEIVTSIHATSDNHETECLFRLLGLHEKKAADEAIRDHWKTRGLTFTGLRMEDGCGLARADFITPHDLTRLQYLAANGPQGTVYKDSLLSKGTLHWKGGAMSSIRSTTGMITANSGKDYYFTFMINHYADGQAASALRDALIEAIQDL
ncbi:MAG: D-alanyl-D-alanine carboxypeptidase/D-alanyl-D-alanine-endopeptidase [Verrucomicrobia bacterium]|nr:D-alanyl-D-alanine carboxypeptidase/D-alanyl-D-alanine-endopeptidase [Verrucomicrobiota bacterium]